MRKAKTGGAVAPDAPNIHIAWAKSMENLASSSVVMSHEMATHQVYKAEPMSLVDSSQASEPSPIRPDHNNIYSEQTNGLATSTPETESSKGGFPSRTYHSIKDMISSRFSSNKEKTPHVESNNTSLSPQSQLRQHGVYMGPATSSSAQDLRPVGRSRTENGFNKGNIPPNQQVESVYQTPPSAYRQVPHHHHQQHHTPQLHQPPHHQQDGMMTPGLYKQPPRSVDQNYNMARNSYVQQEQEPQWHHHQQGEVTHHSHHQQLRYNGAAYPPQGTPQPLPMNRISYNGTPGPSRFDQHHQQQIHHHQQHYSPVMRGQATPHRSPRAIHQPLQGRPPPSAAYQQAKQQDKGRQSPGQTYQQSHDSGRQSPTIYQLGKPPPETPPPSQIHQLVKQPPDIKSSPVIDKHHESQSTSGTYPEPVERLSQTQPPTSNGSTSNPEQSAPNALKRTQTNSQDTLDSGQSSQLSETVIQNTTKAEVQPQVPEETSNVSPNNPSTSQNSDKLEKKSELTTTQRLSKLNLDQEDDDEGGFVKAGVQTDSGRGSTIYSSTKTKPSPEPGPANGGVGEWADLVESELRNILGPGNNGGNSTLSESISSVSPPLPPLSPTQSSDELNFRNRKGRYSSKGASSSGWRSKNQHRSQLNSVKTSRNGVSSSLEIDSMLDENNSSDDDLDYTDVRAIRKQLEGLETMYSQVLKLLGVKKRGGSRYESSEARMHKRRVCGSISSVPSSVSSRPIRDRRKELRHKVRDIKGINKRFQRLESHVVTLARSVAHLSSEMRTQHLMMQEMEVIRSELASLRLLQQATRNTSPAKPTPDKVKKLTKFFGDEPPLLRLFLKQLGYEKYAPVFEKERIGLVELPYMSEERLHKLGIPLGPRLRIMQQAQFALATQHPNTLCIV